MTENKRIILNVIATYGRSLFSLICGLFTSRWILMALGEVDYGLYGVVGGITAFIAFFNTILATSVGRFYAVAVGESQKEGSQGIEICRQWFNTAVQIHTVIPLLLMAVGYVIAEYAVRCWLTIPADRLAACIWVLRFSCLSSLVNMMAVPYTAMYIAKQYIAELTVYNVVQTGLNVCFLYYMVTHPGIWLAKYALGTCLLASLPQIIIALRAWVIFPECKYRSAYLLNWGQMKELIVFSGWSFWGGMGNLLKGQGIAILVNKTLGPALNAPVAVATSVSTHTTTLSTALVSAFQPVIASAYGAGNREKMVLFMNRTCKFGTVLSLLFSLPLAVELPEVMKLWLKNPPENSIGLTGLILLVFILESLTTGHWVTIAANGKIALYQFAVGIAFISTLPIAWGMIVCGWGVYSVGYALLITILLVVLIRLHAVWRLLKVSPGYWIKKIFLPLLLLSVICLGIGYSPHFFMDETFIRLLFSVTLVELLFLPGVWFVILDTNEREWIRSRVGQMKETVLKGLREGRMTGK